MGYMQHHAIVVTSFLESEVEIVRDEAIKLGMSVTEIISSLINNEYTFLVGPDGSKLGWDVDKEGNAQREELVLFIKSLSFDDGSSGIKWAEVLYGDENGNNALIQSDAD